LLVISTDQQSHYAIPKELIIFFN